MDLQTVGDQLYAVLPADFVRTRKTLAAQAKESGHVDLAKVIGRLPKPTVAAWAVNMLVRHRTDEIDQVLTLGESLRSAQGNLDAAQMRELTMQRRQLTAAVTRSARAVAAELGNSVSASVAEQVESTLHAAMVDEGAAAAVRAGQLTEPLVATGFGTVDVTSAMSTRPAPARAPSAPKLSVVPDDTVAREEAQERASRAADALREAEDAAAGARQRAQRLTARSLEVAERLEELRRQVDEQEHALAEVEEELSEAEAAQTQDGQTLADARSEAKAAQRQLDALS